jgi:high-affinity nickel permease
MLFEDVERGLGIAGTSVSAAFLLAVAAANLSVLIRASKEGRVSGDDLKTLEADSGFDVDGAKETFVDPDSKSDGVVIVVPASESLPKEPPEPSIGGPCARCVMLPLSRLVDAPYKAFPLGLLFGLDLTLRRR